MNKPKRIIDIDRGFVAEYAKTTTPEERRWMELALGKANIEKGEKYGFSAFRVEFAKRYFPEIIVEKTTKKKPTLLAELKKMVEADNMKVAESH